MDLRPYTAAELFGWLTGKEPFLLLDVRNDVEFGRFKVEGPFPIDMVNVPYMAFIEFEEESAAKVPKADKVRIVCAKEGSAKYVGEILVKNGLAEVDMEQQEILDLGKNECAASAHPPPSP